MRIRGALQTLALLAALAAAPALAQEAPREAALTLSEYRALLARAIALAERDTPAEEFSRLRRELPDAWRVSLGDSEVIVSAAALRRELHGVSDADDRAVLAARLRALDAQAAALESAPAPPADARERLEAILARREFRGATGPTWFDLVWERVGRALGRLLRGIFGNLGRLSTPMEVLVWMGIAALFIALTLGLVRAVRRSRAGAQLELESKPAVRRDGREWIRRARQAAARQDWREALHAAYWAAVWRMEETGAWMVEQSRTPREYLRLLPRDSAFREPLGSLTRRFELAWYGYRPATGEDYAAAAAELEALGCPREC
jgi:hypothetical protein